MKKAYSTSIWLFNFILFSGKIDCMEKEGLPMTTAEINVLYDEVQAAAETLSGMAERFTELDGSIDPTLNPAESGVARQMARRLSEAAHIAYVSASDSSVYKDD